MSVIQKIQEKYAKLMAIIIAIALMIFVVMLAFENGGNLFQGMNSNTVGKVNGRSIEYKEFSALVDRFESSYQQQYNMPMPEQALQQAWNYEVEQQLLKSELEKLGIEVGGKEMGDMLYGANPPDFLRNAFTDSAGTFNAIMAKQRVDQILKMKSGTAEDLRTKQGLMTSIDDMEKYRLNEKYRSLFANSVNTPKWFIEKENADRAQMARMSVVKEFYAAVADTTIKVTDKEVQDYINKNKDDFKQPESRSISYVAFSASPSAADSAAVLQRIQDIKTQMDTTPDVKKLLISQGGSLYDSYIGGSHIQIRAKDSIFRIPVGTVYGPYLEETSYSLAKLLGVRNIPDTVKARHILIAYEKRDPQTGAVIEQRDSVTAKKLADSVRTLIAGGANFDTLVAQISDDGRSIANGGVYDNVVPNGGMVQEFNDYIFTNPTGSKGVVKTEFGYHYIEILSQKGNSPAYKVAYISKPIEVSAETESNASNEANLFAGESRNQKTFDANAEKLKAKGINKNIATDITPMAYQIPGLGESRSFIKKIYKADKGEVIDPERVGSNYVVAIVTEVIEEGTQPVSRARFMVESILRNKKVAEKIKQKIGNPASLEAAAQALGGKAIENIDSLRLVGQQTSASASGVASENKVIGAAFNPANKGKVVVVEGRSALFVIRVDDVIATPVGDANVAELRKAKYEEAKPMTQIPSAALRKSAKIKDNRSDFF